MRYYILTALTLAALSCIEAFVPVKTLTRRPDHIHALATSPFSRHDIRAHNTLFAQNLNANNDRDNDDNLNKNPSSKVSVRRRLKRWLREKRAFVAIALALATARHGGLVKPPAAHASAPVMALPKAEGRDPLTEALSVQERKQVAQTQQELRDVAAKAREIEATQGERARLKFEQEWQAQKQQAAIDKKQGLEKLKRELLDQGIDPFTDLEGKRQVLLHEKGVDLGQVPGTQFHLEKEWERKNPKKSMKVQKEPHRRIKALMVQDMKNRGLDPLEYFQQHPDKSEAIMDLSMAQATMLVERYSANLEQYGSITVPKEGELSVKEQMKLRQDLENPNAAKEEAKRQKAEAKAREKEERARAKAEAKAAKEKAKEEKAALKAAAQAEKAAAKAARQAKDAAQSEGDAVEDMQNIQYELEQNQKDISFDDDNLILPEEESLQVLESIDGNNDNKLSQQPVKIVSAAVVLGGGAIAFKVSRDRKSKKEEERQKKLRLLMGENDKKKDTDKKAKAPPLEETETDVPPLKDASPNGKTPISKKKEPEPKASPAPAPVEPPKKKKLDLKKVFSKNKNERETDIRKLVQPDAFAPEFAKLLAKLLTFGAPGRFSEVEDLPGEMPMSTFDLEEAKKQLSDARQSANLELEETAEIFANVVNCMLITIVDLAAASLGEKDDQTTVKAINVVVDFMNHAASLYDSVAEGVNITPVTYGGSIGQKKLEQMYSAYAVSGMMNMGSTDESFDSRVSLLQDVFTISDKKAEGLMMKAVQKNMMKMLKDGGSEGGMEEMLKNMGGMDGLGTDGEPPNPEQLKEMLLALKQLKESGSIPPSELETVKKQFKESFGSSIEEVMKDADSQGDDLSESDKELLDLMKSILD